MILRSSLSLRLGDMGEQNLPTGGQTLVEAEKGLGVLLRSRRAVRQRLDPDSLQTTG
ncbi:MAG: hypothetical protein NTY64_08760 [Deltaproteobacteria bacterium]|nr:hypothetical protein [Deltaproteobacteria bacterium]